MDRVEPFKTCPSCKLIWRTRDNFLADDDLLLNGYQVDFLKLEDGLFMFTHHVKGCNSTMALKVSNFEDLFHGEIYPERRTGEEDCPGYCIKEGQFDRCEAKCECAYVREIIQMICENPHSI